MKLTEVNFILFKDLTDDDITAQAMLFFFGGFESISNLLSFTTYAIAVNPDVQEKLHDEIDRIVEEENGITYEGVAHKMKYLDMVINGLSVKVLPIKT